MPALKKQHTFFLRDALITFHCTYILISSSLVGLPAFWFGDLSSRKVSARIISKLGDDDDGGLGQVCEWGLFEVSATRTVSFSLISKQRLRTGFFGTGQDSNNEDKLSMA